MTEDRLSIREQRILEAVVRNYISSAEPSGSRFLSKHLDLGLSPASIRNVMGDLEEKGFISQPHTSAGRIPTDKGYRYYVDCMMEHDALPDTAAQQISSVLTDIDRTDLHVLMEATTRALSKVTNQLGVVLAPRLFRGVFRHVHIFEIEPHRFLLHLTIDSGFVKTMVVEFGTEIEIRRLESACTIINQRFYGMRLDEFSDDGDVLFAGVDQVELGVIRLFVPSIKKMLRDEHDDEVFVDGETNMVLKPDFADRNTMGAVIEVLEEKKVLMHLIDTTKTGFGEVIVSIGGENQGGVFDSFSVLKTKYKVGNLEGSLGVIGPKRMPYPYLVSAVNYTAKMLQDIK